MTRYAIPMPDSEEERVRRTSEGWSSHFDGVHTYMEPPEELASLMGFSDFTKHVKLHALPSEERLTAVLHDANHPGRSVEDGRFDVCKYEAQRMLVLVRKAME